MTDDHEEMIAFMAPIMDGNAISWRVVYLAVRLQALLEDPDNLHHPFLQMRLRGMFEAFGWIMGNSHETPDITDEFPAIATVGGHEIDMDIVGRGISESLLDMLTKISGKSLLEIFKQEVGERGCDRDFQDFLMSCYDEQAEKEMSNFDENIRKLLDTKE